MALQSNPERVAVRLAPYIGELQEFFTSRSMRFGAPEDLAPIALLLSVPGSFHDEMASMIRSIIYREHGTVPHAELLELVTVAIGGPQVDEAAQELYEPVRRLLAFISGVLRSKRSPFLESKHDAPAVAAISEQTAIPTSDREHSDNEATVGWADSALEVQEPFVESIPISLRDGCSNPAPRTNTEVYFRASAILSTPGEPALVEDTASSGTLIDLTDAKRTQDTPDLISPEIEAQPMRHTFSWAIALGLIPAFLFINIYLNHRSAPASSQAGSQTTSASNDSVMAGPRSIPATAPLPSARIKGPAVGQVSTSTSPSAPSRPSDPGSALQMAPSPAAGQGNVTQQARLSRGASFAAASQAEVSSPSAKLKQYSKPVATAPSHTASLGVPTGHPARIHQYTRQGSFAVSSGVMTGNLVSAPAPTYPVLASFARIQGQVILQAVVSRDGSVVDTRIIRGPRMLRGAATQAVRRWRYRPYVLNGKPTDVATIVTVDFSLHH